MRLYVFSFLHFHTTHSQTRFGLHFFTFFHLRAERYGGQATREIWRPDLKRLAPLSSKRQNYIKPAPDLTSAILGVWRFWGFVLETLGRSRPRADLGRALTGAILARA